METMRTMARRSPPVVLVPEGGRPTPATASDLRRLADAMDTAEHHARDADTRCAMAAAVCARLYPIFLRAFSLAVGGPVDPDDLGLKTPVEFLAVAVATEGSCGSVDAVAVGAMPWGEKVHEHVHRPPRVCTRRCFVGRMLELGAADLLVEDATSVETIAAPAPTETRVDGGGNAIEVPSEG